MHHSNFVHLHLHTQYSLLDGMIRPDELLRLAREYKMPAVAMTDHGNMFGAVDFYHRAMSAGVKPIIGAEVYVATGKRTDKQGASKGGPEEHSHHLVLLVKDETGYRNLCKLLTLSYLEGFYYRPRVDKELLSTHNEGLIALSACMHGEVPYLVGRGLLERAGVVAGFYRDVFKDRFYLELQHNGIEEQARINTGLIELGRGMDIPLVATNDCHYLRKDDARFHDVLLCIQTGKTVASADRLRFPTDEFYFKSPEEMTSAFSHVPDAIRNTVVIAERCNLELKLGESHLPDFPVPEGETLDSLLAGRATAGLEARLAAMARAGVDIGPLKRHYHDRLSRELAVIKGMGFSGYFLIVLDFIERAKSRSIPVGPGRGSAAGSLAAFALGITDLDPIKYNLLFERFLNPDRISLPDIDIDFCIDGREDVIRYVSDKYGADNVTQVITFGQMKAKAAIRDVGRALDMSYGDVDRIAKLVPDQLNITLAEAIEKEPGFSALMQEDPRVRELMDVAARLEGLPRHASTHAAGVVISNRPVVEYLPLYRGQKENIVTTQYPMHDVEKIGLVKFDFLGLKTLTVINDTFKAVKETYGVEIRFEDMGMDDPATYELLSRAATDGIFQFEGSGMKDLLRKLKPSTFEDLMAAVALHRPGPLQSGMVDDFVKRKHGVIPIAYEVPELRPILETTYGVMVYQEQVMDIARMLAGFTPGDADVLRKAMGKKLGDRMDEQCARFVEGAKKKNIPGNKAQRIFDLMAKFAGYGFNKSHSAAYAIVAYRTAYLKAHYPAQFMAALLTSEMGDGDKVTRYINDLRAMGIEVLGPDLNESQTGFSVVEGRIRFGLGAVKNVGTASVEAMLAARAGKSFDSLLDLLSRVDSKRVNRKVVESLVKCGALDFTGEPRARLYASIDAVMAAADGLQRDRKAGQTSMFDAFKAEEKAPPAYASPGAAEWSEKERLMYEKESLGVYLSSHPLEPLRERLALVTTDTTETVGERRAGETVALGGIASNVKETTTKKGERMAFMRLSDLHGGIEVIVFSDLYRKSRDMISSESPIVVKGRLDADDEKPKLVAEEILPLDEAKDVKAQAKAREGRKAHIRVRTEDVGKKDLADLRQALKESPGAMPVFLHLVYPGGREVVIGLSDELRMGAGRDAVERVKKTLPGAEVSFS